MTGKSISCIRLFSILFITIGVFSSFSNPLSPAKYYPDRVTRDSLPPGDTTKDEVFSEVDIEASFPGGDKAWKSFLEQNIDGAVAAKNNAPVGAYTVVIQFVVDVEGRLSDIRALTHHGYGMEAEVIRLLRKAPRWIPASQGGRLVRAYRKQPVTFMVEGKGNRRKDKNN